MSEVIFEKKSRNPGEHVSPTDPLFKLSAAIPEKHLRRSPLGIPELSELEVVRHFTRLSQKNFCVDTNFYPLGSCTMKYNPRVNDQVAAWPFYARIHPYQEERHVQGMLQVIHELEEDLCRITGMDAFSLQPAAGAQGEFAGLLIVKAYHDLKGQKRTKVFVPDSAHGTNPASAALCGYEVVQIKTDAAGRVDVADLKTKAKKDTACFMMTNPNTLGLFENNIREITRIVHDAGGLVYYDGANLNALLGISRPGDMDFDIVHVNLHKTFAVPHGSGGPGSGPVGVRAELEKFLPQPRLKRTEEGFVWDYDRPYSIGRLRSFYGNVGAYLRSYCYIRALGSAGLKRVSEFAVLAANYLKARLKNHYEMPHDSHCMHEFVCSARAQKAKGVKALDIAKRLLDEGIHAPTVYFPLIVEEALMVEPTETESKQTLDEFADAMIRIAEQADRDPASVQAAPVSTPVGRIDEVKAARTPNLRWQD
ncbi:MAG: aminomethyl-transferring glycine dehydrogenase subunit GcvPB [Candidatus Omnitrophica bacterium]|nr:aminomethyl-transferring glycine dehydrogenase subunit GcvPB [Candidatus Omnitrophota bacterium]